MTLSGLSVKMSRWMKEKREIKNAVHTVSAGKTVFLLHTDKIRPEETRSHQYETKLVYGHK